MVAAPIELQVVRVSDLDADQVRRAGRGAGESVPFFIVEADFAVDEEFLGRAAHFCDIRGEGSREEFCCL